MLHHCIAGEILELFRSCSCGRSRGRRGIGGRGLAVVGGVAAYKIHGREELKVVCSTCIRAEEEPESHAPVRGRRRALTGLIRPQGFRWFRFFPTDEPLGMNQKPSASNSMRRRKKKKKMKNLYKLHQLLIEFPMKLKQNLIGVHQKSFKASRRIRAFWNLALFQDPTAGNSPTKPSKLSDAIEESEIQNEGNELCNQNQNQNQKK